MLQATMKKMQSRKQTKKSIFMHVDSYANFPKKNFQKLQFAITEISEQLCKGAIII